MDALKPRKEGIDDLGPAINADGTLVKYELNLGQAESLSRLAEEYAFFSPALLYLYGRMSDGPLLDFMQSRRENIRLFYKRFRVQIFDGLAVGTDGAWNHALWAVRLDQWPSLCEALLTVTLAFTETQTLIRYGEQPLTIIDPIAADKSSPNSISQIKITAFGVLTGQAQILFHQPASPAVRPRPISQPPPPELALEAVAYFAHKNPLNARLNYQNTQKQEASRARRKPRP